MENVKNESELIRKVEDDNYYYRGRNFDNYFELKEHAEKFFNEITEDQEDREGYYSMFGLEAGECFLDKVRTESYFNEETNCVNTVHYYEAYIDSGVPADSYFYGFYITD